jgi:diguanylate cyclase (GGDEF)-like protein
MLGPMSYVENATREARQASVLFAVAGALAIVNAWAPGVTPADLRLTFTALGALDLLAAAVVLVLPWRRAPRGTLLTVGAIALVIVGLFAYAGRLDPWISFVFMLVVAIWLALSLPRWSLVRLTPAFAATYVAPQLAAGHDAEALSTVGLVVPIVVVLGELVSHAMSALREQSLRDELTGVGNRRHGMEVLERLRPGDAVLVLDLDRFKDINDREGHAGGDAVLRDLGAMLRRTMRGADAVARIGGEEFLVVASQAGGGTAHLADRLVADWRRTSPRTTISVGAAVHTGADTPTAVLARADQALYAAKRGGRDRSALAA